MAEPLTDEELADLVVQHRPDALWGRPVARWCEACSNAEADVEVGYPCAVVRLVEEVRALRAEAWIEAAAKEIASPEMCGSLPPAAYVAVIKKHMDRTSQGTPL